MQLAALAASTVLGLLAALLQQPSSRSAPPSSGGPDFKEYIYDDGTGDVAYSYIGGATTVWLQYFEPIGGTDTIVEIQAMNGAHGNGAVVGTVGGVAIWDDPDDDRDPADCVLLAQAAWTVQSKGTDVYEPVPIPPTQVTSGFFIGAWVVGVGSVPIDVSVKSLGRCWLNGSAGPFDPNNIARGFGLVPVTSVVDGVLCLRASGARASALFCTAKSGLACGTPSISASGTSSAAASSGFQVLAGPARACKQGILVYNTSQLASGVPFQGGTLCVTPTQSRRAGPTDSGGTPGGANCDGTFEIDMNAFAQGQWLVPDCAGAPSGLPPNSPAPYLTLPGQDVYCQFWGRDSVATGSFVSSGLLYIVLP